MFPLKDNIPAIRFPLVNICLIGVNILLFGVTLASSAGLEHFLNGYGFIPARFVALQQQDFLDLNRFVPAFTSMFLHANLLHLLSNMWMLWIFGDNVEDSMGHGRYLLFFLLCGLISVAAQAWSSPGSDLPMVGASGAISGVLGAYFLTYPGARILTLVPIFIIFYTIELPAFFFLGFWLALQFFQGALHQLTQTAHGDLGGVAWWAHIGGFGAGIVLVGLFRQNNWQRRVIRRPTRIQRLVRRGGRP